MVLTLHNMIFILLVWPTSCTPALGGLFVCECICVSADMSPYCSAHDEWLIMKLLQVCRVP